MGMRDWGLLRSETEIETENEFPKLKEMTRQQKEGQPLFVTRKQKKKQPNFIKFPQFFLHSCAINA